MSGTAVLLHYDQTASGQEAQSSPSPPADAAQQTEAKTEGPARHGLKGSYFVISLHTSTADEARKINAIWKGFYWAQVFFDKGDYDLPKSITPPAVTRVDSQIAFPSRQDKTNDGGQQESVWWPTDYPLPPECKANAKPWERAPAVIWNGYIHLPKAGTYYFATVSKSASAVYLNKARVALNGNFGGSIPSEAFRYPDIPAKQLFHLGPQGDAYIVPVIVDGPRDVAIEVRANLWEGPHIELYWVTPDSPRNADGKLVAAIVPSDVLYVDPPTPLQDVATRAANSTLSPDYLYFPVKYSDKPLTLTIRLADKDGKPVAGKKVYVSGLVSYAKPDTIIQPEQPTDSNGVTTAKVRAGDPHDSTFFATDTTDLVDVAQVAHVTFQDVPNSFFPQTYAPYYDGRRFLVEPLPLIVGQPVTIKVPLTNRGTFPAELTVQFFHNNWNIGAPGWYEIGKPQQIRLKPGESREVSATWTPQAKQGHQCFKVTVSGSYLTQRDKGPAFLASAQSPLYTAALTETGGAAPPTFSSSLQQNIGPVSCSPQYMALYTLTGHGIADFCLGGGGSDGGSPGHRKHPPKRHVPTVSGGKVPPSTPPGPAGTPGSGPSPSPEPTVAPANDPLPVNGGPKAGANEIARRVMVRCADIRAHLDVAQKGGKQGGPVENLASSIEISKLQTDYNDCVSEHAAWSAIAGDPPDADYRNLAIAASDTPVGHIDAARVSLERYQAAEDNGDREWMARHLTAMALYFRRVEAAERTMADKEEKEVAQLQENEQEAELARTALDSLITRLREKKPTKEDLQSVQKIGLSAEQAADFYDELVDSAQPKEVKSSRATMLDLAALRRQIGEQSEQLAALLPAATTQAKTFAQNFTVGNPHDKTETVNLLIRRISIPADWQLSLASVPEADTDTASVKKPQPTKPVLKEVESGSHYSVELPAKGTMQVASILLPKEVAANTTAQWAVEGRIGNELIGGMVHEFNVPAMIADMPLPPVGSGAHSNIHFRMMFVIAAALFLFGAFTVFWRSRRRSHPGP